MKQKNTAKNSANYLFGIDRALLFVVDNLLLPEMLLDFPGSMCPGAQQDEKKETLQQFVCYQV
jgi:hypothetical protein